MQQSGHDKVHHGNIRHHSYRLLIAMSILVGEDGRLVLPRNETWSNESLLSCENGHLRLPKRSHDNIHEIAREEDIQNKQNGIDQAKW
jgi:hypothetical protein